MQYKNVKVEFVCIIIYLKEKASKDYKQNERYVLNKMEENGFSDFGVENPIEDIVNIYFDDKDWTKETKLLSDVYNKLCKIFDEVKINLYLSNSIEGEGNTIDVNLDEFMKLLYF